MTSLGRSAALPCLVTRASVTCPGGDRQGSRTSRCSGSLAESGLAGLAQCGYQILQGIPTGSVGMCLGSWQCAGSVCTLCFMCLPRSLGFSCWGHRNRLELWVRCHGCYHSLGRGRRWWEGHRGFGSHWAGTGELEERRGKQGGFVPSSAWCSWQCHSAACGHPPLGHRAVTRLAGSGFGCSRLPDACGSR